MDFRRQIVTCLFSMLRLSFETQKVKENYAIFKVNSRVLFAFYVGFVFPVLCSARNILLCGKPDT